MLTITILAVGRLRKGPELTLISDYIDRATKTGRALGIGPVRVVEVEDKSGSGMAAEAALLRKAIPAGATVVALDERGTLLDSPALAQKVAGWRDEGQRDLVFLIGGADGLAPELRADADMALSFGKMVWPHMLARVMLAEQIYRATTILAGGPYHRT